MGEDGAHGWCGKRLSPQALGRNLIKLIDEIHDEHRQFADSSSVSDTRDPGGAAHAPTNEAVDEVISAGEEVLARAVDSAVSQRSSSTGENGAEPRLTALRRRCLTSFTGNSPRYLNASQKR
jgi:hypothetical protein